MSLHNLDALLQPRSIAVVGASTRSDHVGRIALDNLIAAGFPGTIMAINPKPLHVDGAQWLPSVESLPVSADLAVVAVPARDVPGVIDALGRGGTRVAVVLSAGLTVANGLRQAMLEAAARHDVRIVGPNCLGLIVPRARVNATFARQAAAPGGLALISQSGALVTAMLDWADGASVGFSAVLSVGDDADVDMADLIDLLAADPATKAILLYVEGVTDAARFMSAARAAARFKPVIALKAGRNAASGKAALSHTGALVGAYEVYEAAFRRAGIVMVDSLSEMFDAARILCRTREVSTNRLAIMSNGGGAGILAVDATRGRAIELAALDPLTVSRLNAVLPQGWSHGDPVDLVGDADETRYADACWTLAADRDVDAILVIHCPTGVVDGERVAQALVDLAEDGRVCGKLLIGCWLGGRNAATARPVFDKAGVPLFDNLDDAVRAFGFLVEAGRARAALMRAPSSCGPVSARRDAAKVAVESARYRGRTRLNGGEVRQILSAYNVPMAESRLATSVDAIEVACSHLPAPYVVKIVSPQVTHKSDIGGVALGLADGAAAMAAATAMAERIRREHPDFKIEGFTVETMFDLTKGHELIVGLTADPTFGPIVAVGAGGTAVELLNDKALGLPPLDAELADAMIHETRIGRLLDGYRGEAAADLPAVSSVLEAFAAIAVDFPEISTLEINPLFVTPNGVVGLDARGEIAALDAPVLPLALRPMPAEWARDLVTREGVSIHVRPVVPTDEPLMRELFEQVSPSDIRFRFLSGMAHVTPDRIAAMVQIDYHRTMTFLAFAGDKPVATAMLAADPDKKRAEVAISVAQTSKGKGISWTLMEHVEAYARAEGIEAIESTESRSNAEALLIERERGFTMQPCEGDPAEVVATKTLVAS